MIIVIMVTVNTTRGLTYFTGLTDFIGLCSFTVFNSLTGLCGKIGLNDLMF